MSHGIRQGPGEPSSARRISRTLLVVVGAAIVSCGWWLWHKAESNKKATPVSVMGSDQADAGLIPAVNLNAEFMGTESCAECHAGECESFAKTGHSRSLSAVKTALEPADGEFYHTESGRHYRVYRDGETLRHQESIRNEKGDEVVLADHPVSMVVGSGNHARTYLVESEGFYMESPLTWYSSKAAWAISPGFDVNNSGFSRAIYVECFFCHSGRVEAVAGNRGRIQIHEHAVNCERCHGPGSAHVEFHREQDGNAEKYVATIVNPGKLSRERKEAICAQCHLHGDAEVEVQGKSLVDFKPGAALSEYRLHYSLKSEEASMSIVGHVEQLRRSQCYQQNEAMTCITCHDPHSKPALEDRVEYYRAKCAECHTDEACKMPRNARVAKSAQDDCVSCHMPSSASDIPHFVATHHRIAVYDRENEFAAPTTAGTLVPLSDLSTLSQNQQDRYLGLAYLDRSIKEDNPQFSTEYRQRAQTILEKLTAEGVWDTEMGAALAQIYQRQNPLRSKQFAERVLQSEGLTPQVRIKALFALSEAQIAARQTSLAIPVLEQLTQLRRQAGDWYFLAACRYHEKDLDGALDAGEIAVAIRPDRPNFHALLAELYLKTGRAELAKHHQQLSMQLTQLQKSVQQQAKQ